MLAAAVLLVLLVWLLPLWLTHEPHVSGIDRQTSVNGARTSLAAVVAAFGGVGGLLYTARTFRLAGQGQVAERYTKAVEQLGSEHISVRVGGVHGLERTVRDGEAYRRVVARVLCAFLRDRTDGRSKLEITEGLDTDVVEALSVLRDMVNEDTSVTQLDLRGVRLPGADLTGMSLVDARLSHACLLEAKLSGANLEGAYLLDAELNGAILYETRMKGAILTCGSVTAEQLRSAIGSEKIDWRA